MRLIYGKNNIILNIYSSKFRLYMKIIRTRKILRFIYNNSGHYVKPLRVLYCAH